LPQDRGGLDHVLGRVASERRTQSPYSDPKAVPGSTATPISSQASTSATRRDLSSAPPTLAKP